jgi:hypothetical protein
MNSKSVLPVVVISLLLVNVSFAVSVKPATNTTARMSEPKSAEQLVYQKLMGIVVPEVVFRPPATLVDFIDFLKAASIEYDDPEIPLNQRGVNFILKLPRVISNVSASATAKTAVPVVPSIRVRQVTLYETLKLVCDLMGMKFHITGNVVMVVPLSDPDKGPPTVSYNDLVRLSARQTQVAAQGVEKKMKAMVLPEVAFRPPANLVDAIDFFSSIGKDDDPESGVNVVLMLGLSESATANTNDPFVASAKATTGIPLIPAMSVRFISLYDVLKLVCDATGTKIQITGNIVRIVPRPGCENSQAPARSKTGQK